MPRFVVDIPVQVSRETTIDIEYEPARTLGIRFKIEADSEAEAVEVVGMLLLNQLEETTAFDETKHEAAS